MDNKDNLDGGSTNRDPGSRGNPNTSHQQAVLNTNESRVSSYLATRVLSLKPADELTTTMDKDYPSTPPTVDPGGGKPPVRSTSNTMDDKDTLGGGSTNDDPFLSTDDPGGGKHSVRSPSNTMDRN